MDIKCDGAFSLATAVTPLDETLIRKAHMRPFSSVSEAVAEALEERGEKAKFTIIMDGGLTIPKPS